MTSVARISCLAAIVETKNEEIKGDQTMLSSYTALARYRYIATLAISLSPLVHCRSQADTAVSPAVRAASIDLLDAGRACRPPPLSMKEKNAS